MNFLEKGWKLKYLNLLKKREDDQDLVDSLVHLEAADHYFDDVVDRVDILLHLLLLVPHEDPFVVVVEADKSH
jgi:hypothetical protein